MDSNKLFNLKNKTIVLTGSAGRLGTRFAHVLSKSGANVVLIDIEQSANKKLERELILQYKTKPTSFCVDISDQNKVKQLIKKIMLKYSKIDVLINNAAYQGNDKIRSTNFVDLPLSIWNKSISVNLTGMFLCSQEIGKVMEKQKRGVLINISSTYGIVAPDQRIYGNSGQNAAIFYSATKSAVLNLSRYLASYWQEKGIRVNTLSPGGVEKGQESEFIKKYSEKTMLGRMAKKDEYVGAILYLASDASSYMTGSNLIVDGGWTAW